MLSATRNHCSASFEKFSDGRVRSGLCQAQTSVRPPSVLTRATRHERKETCQLPIINPQRDAVVKARVTVIPPVKRRRHERCRPRLLHSGAFRVQLTQRQHRCDYCETAIGAVAQLFLQGVSEKHQY
jgi:hypothetical protein